MRVGDVTETTTMNGSMVKRVNLIQIGVGLIGCTTIEQVLDNHANWQQRLGLDVVYRGLVDFDAAVGCEDPDGYSEPTLRAVVEQRKQRRPLAEIALSLGLTPRTGNEV